MRCDAIGQWTNITHSDQIDYCDALTGVDDDDDDDDTVDTFVRSTCVWPDGNNLRLDLLPLKIK